MGRTRRTVKQIPERHAARVAPKPAPVDLDGLPVAAVQVFEARDHARRAEIVLRMPDAVLLADGEAIASACNSTGFKAGADFVGFRLLALHAPRQPDGELPEAHRRCLALWRNGFTALAGSATR